MKAAKNPKIALAERLARDVLHGWRWFIEDDWIVFEVPGRSEISAYDMRTIASQPNVWNVAAVFRCAPHPGLYVRFQVRKASRKTKASQELRDRADSLLRDSARAGDADLWGNVIRHATVNAALALHADATRSESRDPGDNAIGGPNDYAYGM